jgi:metallo-beta-lactamase family protein
MESTYGDREREDLDLIDALLPVVERTLGRGGVLLIPSFAVGRAQLLLYCLHRIFEEKGVPRVPVYLDSPMATDVTQLYRVHHDYHRLSADSVYKLVSSVEFLHTPQESMQLNHRTDPMVIVSAAGMLTGGRVVHHFKAHAGRRQNTILLPGFQAPGTRGAALADGKRSVKVHGQYVDVKAEVVQMDVFSAHADQSDLLKWIGSCAARPREVWLVHGEPPAADELRRLITERVGCDVHVPEYGNTARFQP